MINMDNPFDMPEYEDGTDELQHALSKVVNTPEGRTLIWAILGQSKIYDETFAGNSADIHSKGKRAIGLWLIAMLTEVDPTTYPRMLLDVARREQREVQRLASMDENYDHTG